jgi:hypothetical protein
LIGETNAGDGSSLRLFAVAEARNHSFKNARAEFDQALDEALNWFGTKTPMLSTLGSLRTGQPSRVRSPY